jgi:hypothetical protein
MPRIELCWPDTPVQPGADVAVVVSHLGLWSVNACRIVYVIDERGSPEKCGFAYGTLPDHRERGEERFTVEFCSASPTVPAAVSPSSILPPSSAIATQNSSSSAATSPISPTNSSRTSPRTSYPTSRQPIISTSCFPESSCFSPKAASFPVAPQS